MNLRAGTFLQDRYEVIGTVGSGGMSYVYRARDHKLNRLVAIKVLKEEFCTDETFVGKFQLEAQASAGLLDSNIVNVYDVVDEGNLHYIVMELVEGITLKEYIKTKGKLGISETVGISLQAAKGLLAAHTQQLVHRDIKPQNMIITSDGKVKVADFGIARAVSEQTLGAGAVGSVHYISPEGAKGTRYDARSDIYSLGISMYEMLTGRLPFDGDNTVAIALAHLEQALVPPSVYNPNIPPNLEKIIQKCTKKDPANRYQSVTELITDLEQALISTDVDLETIEEDFGSTKVISQSEIGLINAKRNKKIADIDGDKETTPTTTADKLISALGVIIAIAIVSLILFIFGRVGGFFGTETGVTTQVGDETTLDSTSVYMPDLEGLSSEEAELVLKDNDLYMRISGSEYSDTVEKDAVISQTPAAGEVVSKYSNVTVVLSLGSDKVDISSLGLIGMESNNAKSLLEDLGLEVLVLEEYNDTYEKGRVIAYTPDSVQLDETVTLTVSLGTETEKVAMIDLSGMTEEEARIALEAIGLVLGEGTQVYSEQVEAGIIITAEILSNIQVDVGSTINYTVSAGTQIVETEVDSSTYSYIASIDANYDLTNLIGPGASGSSVNIMIRLNQTVNGQTVYTTLMESRKVTANTILPVRFRTIVGADGVDQGLVEVVEADSGTVLKSYTVEFFKVEY